MADKDEETKVDPTEKNTGATKADASETTSGDGPKEPPAPDNKPPKDPEDTLADDTKADSTPEEDKDDDAQKVKEEAEKNKPLDTDTWGTTGDDIGDSVLSLLQNSGVSTEDAKALLYDAVQAGDVTKVDRAALEEKVGKNTANLILAGAENFVARNTARVNEIKTNVQAAAGGEENWNAITGWAKENISESDLAEYRDLIDAGGAKARFAATDLMSRYNADSNNTTLEANGSKETTGDTTTPPTARATTKAQYVEELGKAYDKGASQAVINEIRAARNRGRTQGI